ncbi:unnamed protein product [Brassica oleracea var. botrytis]|uniref:(rape) hypothetical protein n=1 Tax=Brassica napus TaxID=3708 RepID=A0A078I5V0_BRANA|nr:unnamed protein product [Brassica napus]CDY46235.1 BnaCnng13860D [Brassica napus]
MVRAASSAGVAAASTGRFEPPLSPLRNPVEMSFCVESMLPYHNAAVSALMTSNTICMSTIFEIIRENESAFDLLYCIAFKLMDQQWLSMCTSYMEFNYSFHNHHPHQSYNNQNLVLSNVKRGGELIGVDMLLLDSKATLMPGSSPSHHLQTALKGGLSSLPASGCTIIFSMIVFCM